MKKESELEEKCRALTKKRGGLFLKFLSTVAGVPDRLVILDGRVFFVEFKSGIGSLSPIQGAMIERMRTAGAEVYVLNTYEKFEEVLLNEDNT